MTWPIAFALVGTAWAIAAVAIAYLFFKALNETEPPIDETDSDGGN